MKNQRIYSTWKKKFADYFLNKIFRKLKKKNIQNSPQISLLTRSVRVKHSQAI